MRQVLQGRVAAQLSIRDRTLALLLVRSRLVCEPHASRHMRPSQAASNHRDEYKPPYSIVKDGEGEQRLAQIDEDTRLCHKAHCLEGGGRDADGLYGLTGLDTGSNLQKLKVPVVVVVVVVVPDLSKPDFATKYSLESS